MSQKEDLLADIEALLTHPALGAAWDAEAAGVAVHSYSASRTRIPDLVGTLLQHREALKTKPEQALPGGWATTFRTPMALLELEITAYEASLRGQAVPASRLDLLRVQLEITNVPA